MGGTTKPGVAYKAEGLSHYCPVHSFGSLPALCPFCFSLTHSFTHSNQNELKTKLFSALFWAPGSGVLPAHLCGAFSTGSQHLWWSWWQGHSYLLSLLYWCAEWAGTLLPVYLFPSKCLRGHRRDHGKREDGHAEPERPSGLLPG